MKSMLCVSLLCVAATAQAAKPAKEVGPPQADFSNVVRDATPAEIEVIREAMQEMLKDADSAKFRNVRRIGLIEVCGDVNSKNSMGAYSGYAKFYGLIMTDQSTHAQKASIFGIDTDDSPIAAQTCKQKLP